MLHSNYPIMPMSAVPTVLLNAFLEEQAYEQEDETDDNSVDTVRAQRIFATYTGARARAKVCCGLAGHDAQAAALLMAIDEIDGFLDGALSAGGADAVRKKLDAEEMGALQEVRATMVLLLEWHFKQGAGALLPIAEHMGLVRGGGAK